MSQSATEIYRGWSIYAFEQRHWGRVLPFYALGQKKERGVLEIINAEGDSLDYSINKLKSKIIRREDLD